jgi:hypothetical protein
LIRDWPGEVPVAVEIMHRLFGAYMASGHRRLVDLSGVLLDKNFPDRRVRTVRDMVEGKPLPSDLDDIQRRIFVVSGKSLYEVDAEAYMEPATEPEPIADETFL